MDKKELEIDEWFRKRIDSDKLNDLQVARVTGVHKNSYTVQKNAEDIFAEMTGNLVYGTESSLDYPTVGDWVYVQFFNRDTFALIHEVISRKTILKRKMPGKKISVQPIAANVDTAFVIQSCDHDFNLRRLERYIAIIHEGDIKPIILLSKSDLLSAEAVEDKVSAVLNIMPNIPVIAFSNLSECHLNRVKNLFKPGETYCFLGSSGVGKTTLLNQLIGSNVLKTGEVRIKDGKGKHITTSRQMIELANGAIIIDTPGMRELGMADSQEGIGDAFKEIQFLSRHCRFNDCTHTQEEGCAVLAALKNGTLSPGRYQNYLKMKKESAWYEMSYLEKRRKDKQFGKFAKSIMKNHLKRKKY